MNLFLYIIPGDGPNDAERAIDSCSNFISGAKILKSRYVKHKGDEEFYGYLYWDEYLDLDLSIAMPVFLYNDYWDCLVLFKMIHLRGEPKYYKCPRIFKKEIVLNENLIPIHPKDLYYERALNGWVRGNDDFYNR